MTYFQTCFASPARTLKEPFGLCGGSMLHPTRTLFIRLARRRYSLFVVVPCFRRIT